MKDKRHLFLKLLCFSLVIGATAGGVACKEKTNEPEVPSGYDKTFEEIGSYYADEGETRNTFDLTDSAFSVKIGSAKIEGTYLFNGTTLRLVAADGTVLEAKYNDATITLTYQNKTYKFYKNVEYTVKFEMNGGEAKEDEKVLNGKKLAKPANPVKEEQGKEYVFVGWYKDAAFNEKYSFDQPVTKNITLYARFAELLGKTEFSVTFDGYTGGGQEGTYPVVTTNQTLYNLPVPESENGEEFLGWWRSAYNDKNKLTAQYEAEEPIAENIVLYPVWKSAEKIAVSVKSNKISWSSLGVNKTYELTVKDAEGKVVGGIENRKVSSTEFGEFDFSAQPAGEYTVTVKCGSAETTAYYKNKALARVSAFAVNSPSILTFNAVENAEKYLLTIECGTAEHSHEDIDLGVGEDNKPVTFYDFSDCDMQAGGIRFTVKAVADGMLTSVSETWSFERTLNAATNLAVEDSTQQASWDAVENAKYYLVQVNDGDAINVGDKTSFDLRGYEKGAYSVKVIAVAKGYNNSPAAETEWTKATLPTPANLSVSGYTLNWTAVDGANGYVVKIGEKEIDVTTNSYTLQAEDYVEGQTEYGISVSAKDTAAAGNSLFTKTLTVQSGKIAGELSYEKGFLSWNPGFGVAKYEVQVNDGAITEVKDVGTAVTLTKAGENTLRVRSYDEKGNASAWIEKKVTAYTVSYDVGENERKIDDAYVAVGDSIALPESIFEGYDFGGWYNGQNGAGTKYEEVSGTLPTLGAAEDLTLYAKWTPKQYNVVLNKGAYSDDDLSAGATVSYKEAFELPVPSSNNKNKAFMGWYAGTTQITDHRGESKDVWRYLTGQTLEARWVDVFKFASLVDGSYSVTQADGVKYLTEVTVPTEYNNKRVSTVEAYAFKDAKNLTTINIPESIANIENTAFEGCTGLLNLNIYKVEGTIEPVYYSPVKDNGETDGIIVKNDSAGKTLQFFPLARTGEYTIPSGVETIAANVFTGCKLEVIKIPASVNYVAMNAFKSCTSLTEIEFLQAEDGVEEKLIIADKAFASSYNIKKITLPARLTNMTLFNGEKKNDYTWAYERSAFYGCNRLSEIYVTGTVSTGRLYSSSENGLLLNADGTELLYWAQGRTETEVALPSSVTKIADKAFYGNKKITTFIVPARIVEIGESAFENCENLATLTFEGTEADAALEIKERAFYGCNITELTLTENVRTIGKYAFGDNSSSNTSLSTVTVKSSGEVSFADGAFASFTRNFTTGEITGSGNSTVTTLIIGKDVSVINISGAFGGTSSKLATVNVDKDNKYYLEEESVIYDKNAEDETKSKTEILYYPVGKQGEYVVPSTVTKIGANVFVARKGLTKITIGNNVTSIGDAAFKGCTNLAEIVWGEPAEGETAKPLTIGERAFEDCDSFVSFTLPARVTALGDMAFYNCDSIVTFDFAANSALKTIGEKAFAGLDKLQTIALPEGVVSVGNYAFSDCENLTKVTFPSTVERLGKWTETTDESGVTTYKFDSMDLFKSESTFIFSTPNYYSKNLEEVEVASGNKHYASKDGMLYGKDESGNLVTLYFCPFKKAGEVLLPNTLTLIYDEAFALNTGVTTVKFDGALAGDFKIGEKALYKASALTTFELPQGLTKIVKGLFKDCSDLTGIVVPNTVTSIEAGAFEGCVSLSNLTFEGGNDDTPLTLEDGEYSSSSSGSSGSDVYTGVFSYYYQGTGSASNTKILKSCVSLTSVQFPKRLAKIGTFAFYKCSGLETVTFAEDCNLTEIGDGAFTDSGLTAISLPGRLTTIGMEAFRGAKFPAGTAINIPASVTEYGKQTTKKSATRGVFGDTSVSKITFADNSLLETVYEQAFYSPELTEVSFGNNSALTTLKSRAFTTCSKLALVNFGENSKLQTIESNAFYNCKALTSVSLPATLTTIGKNAFEGCAALTSVTFATYAETDEETGAVAGKSSLRSIGDQAFLNTGLTSFTFPSTKEPLVAGDLGLGKEMFKGCKKLVTINLSETVKDISKVFDLCGSIKKITVPEGGYFVADGAVLYNVKQTELVYILGDVEGTFNVKDGVTTINPSTFAGKATLKEIYIPKSVMTIGEKAFYDCLGLKKVTFETNSTLAKIGASAFRNCVSLTDITIPVGVTVIDEYTFYNCKSLKTIAVPKNVTMIKKYAFYNCKALETVTLPEGLTNIGYYERSGKQSLTSSGGYSFAYCTSLKNINIPSTVQWIQNYSFQNCTSLENVDLNVTDKQLGSNAFENCTALQKVTLNANITSLPSYLFRNCTSLNSVLAAGATESETPVVDLSQITKFDKSNFENCTAITGVIFSTSSTLTALASSMFKGCTSLTSVNLPANIKTASTNVFQNCTALTSVTINGAMTSLGNYMFAGCSALTSIDLSKATVTGVPQYFFDGCANLATVKLNAAKITTINKYAFRDCTSLVSALPEDAEEGAEAFSLENLTLLATINEGAFMGCAGLTSVVLPAKVISLSGEQIFRDCVRLQSVTFNGAIKSFGRYTFAGCTSLQSIDLSKATATSIAKGMFDGCTSLSNITVNATALPNITAINDYAFRNCVSLAKATVVNGTEKTEVDFTLEGFTALKTIGTEAFAGCDGLTSVVLPTLASATGKLTVSASAFNGCANLESVSISKNVSSIGAAAFGSCAKLAKITVNSANSYYKALNGVLYTADGAIVCVPAGVEMENYTLKLQEGDTIAAGALDGCVNVKKIVLPEAMTSVADKLFQGLTTLEEVVLSSQTESIGANAFENTGLKKITYTGAEEEAAAEGETALKTSVFPATLKFIGKYAFQNTKLEKVILPATLNGLVLNASGSSISTRTVGDAAFAGSALQSVVIEGSETFFGGSATAKDGVFYNCVNLTRVEFTSNTAAVLGTNASLGQNMFSGCTALESVVLPDTEILPSYMFDGCVKLASVNIPASVTELPSGIFRGAAFTEITVPAGISAIGRSAFSGCANLAKVTFNEGLTSIGSSAFSGCVALTSVILPEGLLTIDGFSGCVNLASVNIPSTVTKISSGAFDYCTALKSIVLPASLETVAFAFEGWTAEQTVYVEAGAADVYNLWATDSDSGFGSFLDKSYSGPFYQMDAKIVWNYNASAGSSAETEGEGGAA
ncbi:MAG: leucine-rich repeat protein [Candidatus Borkfalkiaceae bacterium]|nr:leucine-rich repeat protein [Clostridia bacterium]MDY6223567.1 leucine-rich repeat protein [Christensenellaceae bacterium]